MDQTVQLWDSVTGAAALQTLKSYSDWVTSVTFLPDGRVVPALSAVNDWVVEGDARVLWLPDYRVTCVAVWKTIIVLGHWAGKVFILGRF